MHKKPLTYEELYHLAKQGDDFAYETLANRFIKLAIGITVNTINQKGIKGFDMSEAKSIANEAILTTFAHYKEGKSVKNYFVKVYLRELFKYIKNLIKEREHFLDIELDESAYDGSRITNSEIFGSQEEDPRKTFELNELNFILSDVDVEESYEVSLQRKALQLKRDGFEIKDIAKILKMSESQLRRLLEKDEPGTPLRDIKIKLK